MPSNNLPPASPLVRFRRYLSGQATHIYLPLLINLLIVLSGYMICRMAFYLENRALLGSIALPDAWGILRGGLRYDLSTFCYTNALYVLLAVIMSQSEVRRDMNRFLKILFATVNGIGWASCLADAAYYPYIGRRVTASVFAEFQNDNLSDIFLTELLHHW
ncbi:MAG: hypothetical protein IJ680_02130, partial [Paludibacteraceae bacterium]|nr:hypothetical protein [Paludibacteraceae bacterium]